MTFGLIGLTVSSITGSSKTDLFVEIRNILFAILRQPYLGLLIFDGLHALEVLLEVFWSKPTYALSIFIPAWIDLFFHNAQMFCESV